jgi:hypothetical protein
MLHPDYVGFRIWYEDGSVKSSLDGSWEDVPSQGVQFVTVYEARTYEIWIETQWVTENYCVQLHSQDYYWLDIDGRPGSGSAETVPDLPLGTLKTGSTMFEVSFWDLAAQAQTVRITP